MMLALMMSTLSLEEEGRFQEIYEQYNVLVYYIAYDILKDKELAEETAQEVFVKVICNFKLFAGGVCDYSKNLIAVMAKNMSVDVLRKQKAQDRLEKYLVETDYEDVQRDEEVLVCKSPSAEERYLERAAIEQLAVAVHNLSEKERRAIELHYYNHLKIKETATVMDVSESAVKKLLQRGLAHLRDTLEKEEL
ncbi:MAG: sigma-70 family RNA polymerase sigma factor [Lachnospiraceae bacterium]|nr:sigma-70 family RNA polymerase sigma factor [Lachnospiraceae bacterium]